MARPVSFSRKGRNSGVLGFEHSFGGPSQREGRPTALRIELYEHRISDPRPRFENLYDPISLAPEAEADRFRVAPQSSRSRGIELFSTGGGRRVDWFASYAYSRIEDRIDGREVLRSIDQPHALKLGVRCRLPKRWEAHLALELRSGWPTTPLSARTIADEEDDEPEVVPVLGALYGERLPTYRRLDLRASRRFDLHRGELELIFDVQNLTNAENTRGFDISLEAPSELDEPPEIERERKLWAGIAPSFGLRWAF